MTHDTLRAWLAARQPAPPLALAERLERVVAACPSYRFAGATMAGAMSVLGVAALTSLEGRDPESPDVALDLLAADALVTYAFEAAAEEGTPVERVTADLLARVRA
jgi:hypothetical protein